VIKEDPIKDSERKHSTEQAGVLVFQSAVSLALTPRRSGFWRGLSLVFPGQASFEAGRQSHPASTRLSRH
jgi:hypothetical protein